MKWKISALILFTSLLCWRAEAQMFEQRRTVAPAVKNNTSATVNKTVPAKARTLPNKSSQTVTVTVEANVAPVASGGISAEQQAAIPLQMMRTINKNVQNSSPQENKRLIQAIAALEKAKARQENLGAAPGEEVVVDEPKVNPANTKEVETYLQQKFMVPLSSSVTVEDTFEDDVDVE